MTDEAADDPLEMARRAGMARAQALKPAAEIGGLRCEVFLPPDLASWVLSLVARGEFLDPSEAVFVFLGQARDLDPHDDLKGLLLQRCLDDAMQDGATVSAEEVSARLEEMLSRRHEPAVWDDGDREAD